ncbi:MAG TPA: hypothetical protein VFE78_18635 [Gemmataceae bacterium]|jgi:hypothetical protein|nr:hypothetical protein [Gemmataceae bacterium]
MSTGRARRDADEQDRPSGEAAAEQPPAWEQIESGRYMPRRTRGSLRGRELG